MLAFKMITMKRNYLLFAVVLLASCSKGFLNLNPPTSLSSASYYKNVTEFQQALNGAYTPLRTIVYTGIYQDETRSDNTFFTIYQANRGLVCREDSPEFLDDPTTSAVPNSPGDGFTGDYSGIAMINTILG